MVTDSPRLGLLDTARLDEAYPWPRDAQWLRVVMVRTLDGAVAGPDGLSGSISSATDRLVLAEIRRLCDVQLIGASTVRAEPYGPVLPRADAQEERAALGLAPAPRVVVVSASLDLPWDAPLLARSAERPLVVTVAGQRGPARVAAEQTADIVELPGPGIDSAALLARLADLGLRRVVCEGGPGLVASLLDGGVVDEVNLSLSPTMVDSAAGGTAGGGVVGSLRSFALRHALSDGEFLFTRYTARSGQPA